MSRSSRTSFWMSANGLPSGAGGVHRLRAAGLAVVYVEELKDLLLDVGERLALRGAEAHRARARGLEPGRRLQLDRGGRQPEQVVKLGLYGLRPAEERVEEAHYRRPRRSEATWPSSPRILLSC